MKLAGKGYTQRELLKKVGRMEQIGGARPYTLTDGSANGTRAIDVNNGAGLLFTVLPDRGLDISRAYFNGASLCFQCQPGETNPAFYDADGLKWLDSFYGGLLITCGMTHMGQPSEDEGQSLGLHGPYSNIPASGVCCHEGWEDDDYAITISGRVREARIFGANIVLERQIRAQLASPTISIRDRVVNEGFDEAPFMILYHCNPGFPLLDEGARLYSPTRGAVRHETRQEVQPEQYNCFPPPTHGISEEVFYHDMEPDAEGYVSVILANHDYDNGRGLGLLQRYQARNLPCFNQWKMCGESTYVMGLEPGNCNVQGRAKAREEGVLRHLQPGEVQDFHLELTVLTDNSQIDQALKQYGLIEKA